MSVLFMKPQLAAPAVVWLVLRRDLRALCGMALGAAIQVLAVMVLLGPAVPLNYVVALPGIGRAAKLITLTGAYEQSFGGTISNVLRGWYWLMPERHAAAAAAQLVVAVLAGFLLLKIVEANRRLARRGPDTAYAMHYEYAAAALFLLVATPHLLLYDVSLLAVPIVWLWSSPGWRMGMVLYLSATVLAAFLCVGLGFSLTVFLALAALADIADELVRQERSFRCPDGTCPTG
jgi:hypothetical protein